MKKDIAEKVDRLKHISLFQSIAENDKAMEEIAALLETVTYKQGDNVIEENEVYGDSLYIIKTGTVEIVKKTLQGDPYVVTALSADMNIFFGEVALLDPDRRSATVHCQSDCEFYRLSRDKFIKYGDTHPVIGLIITRELSRIVCKRLRKSNDDIVTLFGALVDEVEKSGGIG